MIEQRVGDFLIEQRETVFERTESEAVFDRTESCFFCVIEELITKLDTALYDPET